MATEIDQQFVEYVVKSLVSHPDAVKVDRSVDEKGVLLELTVDPEDLGRVIGKHGATAQSMRTLLRALGTKNDARYNLKIVDNGEPRESRQPASGADNTTDNASASSSASDDDDIKTMSSTSEETHETSSGTEDDLASRTRKELAELDDLDLQFVVSSLCLVYIIFSP